MKSVQPVVHKTRKLESINQKIQDQTRQNLDFINKGRFEVKNSVFIPSWYYQLWEAFHIP